jgi:hypothetical protein
MKFYKVSFIFLGMFLVACSSQILPNTQRSAVFNETTNKNSAIAYESTLLYLAENLGDSKESIKFKSNETKTIAGDLILACSIFNQTGDFNTYDIKTFYKFTFENNKAKFKFTNVKYINAGWSYLKIVDIKKMEKVKNKCLKPFVDEIKNAI